MIRRGTAPLLPALLVLLALLVAAPGLRAQGLIRDAGMEHALDRVAGPILSAAGLGSNAVSIMVLNDRALNAFVVDGRHVFIHSGLLTRLDDPAELQAVIAHELAHITNGHLTRRVGNFRSARTAAGLGMALGLAVARRAPPMPAPAWRRAAAAPRCAVSFPTQGPRKPPPTAPRCAPWRRPGSIPRRWSG